MFQAAVPAPAPNALYTLSIGSNDLDYIFAHDAGNPAQALADASAVLGNIASFVGDLAADGARNLVALMCLISARRPPRWRWDPRRPPPFPAVVAGFDASLMLPWNPRQRRTASICTSSMRTGWWMPRSRIPRRFGLTDVSDPCLVGDSVCATPDSYLFWDEHHPTETGERLLASVALQAIPEPSTPAVLAGAILLLGLVRRRRMHARA